MDVPTIDSGAIRERLLKSQALVPDDMAVPVNYVSLRENVFLRELDAEITILLELLNTPDQFVEAFKERYAARELRKDQSIPFAEYRNSPTNQLYWDIVTLVFKPATMKDMLAILMPGVTRSLAVSFPDQLAMAVRDTQSLRSAADNLVPVLTLTTLDELTAAPTLDELSHYVIADDILFDVRAIQPLSLGAHSQFYKALQQHHPAIADKLYPHNYTLTVLKSDILTFQSKGKTPRAALEQLKNAFILSGSKMTGSEFASKRATIGATEFMNYFDNVPDKLKEKLLLLKGGKTLKEIIDDIITGQCVESTATSINTLLEKNASNPLLNAIIPTSSLNHLFKRYRFSRTKADQLQVKYEAPDMLSLPAQLLKSAIKGMAIDHPEDLVDLILNFTPDNYELLLANLEIKSPDEFLENVALIIGNNILSAEQYQALLDAIVKMYVQSRSLVSMLSWMMSINHPDVIKWTIEHYAASKKALLAAATILNESSGYTVLHHAVKANSLSVRAILELIPQDQRMAAVCARTDHNTTVMRFAIKYPRSLQVIFELIPKAQRLEAVCEGEPNVNKVLFDVAYIRQSLQMILAEVSETERLSVVTATAVGCPWSVLNEIFRNGAPFSLLAILELLTEAERIQVLKTKAGNPNISHVSMLSFAADHPESLPAILELIPEAERLKTIKTAIPDHETLLHRVARHSPCLKYILSLYPKEEQLAAVKVVDRAGKTVLHRAANNAESLKHVLDLYPQEERLAAVQTLDNIQVTVLHYAASNAESLQRVLELYPKDKRRQAVEAGDHHGNTLLHYATTNPQSLRFLLELYPEAERLTAVNTRNSDGETILLLAVKDGKLQCVQAILEALPANQRLDAVKQIGNDSESSVLDYVETNPELLQAVFELIPKAQRLEAIQTRTARHASLLHAVVNTPNCLRVILDLTPEDQRLAAVKTADENGHTVLNYARNVALQTILERIPPTERLEAVTTIDKHENTMLHYVAHDPQHMRIVLNAIPEADRLEAVTAKINVEGNTVMHKAAHFKSLLTILSRIPKDQRLRAMTAVDRGGLTVLQTANNTLDFSKDSTTLKQIYRLLYGDQAEQVIKDALLSWISALQTLLNEAEPATLSSTFFQQSNTKSVLMSVLKNIYLNVNTVPANNTDDDGNLQLLLQLQQLLNKKVNFFKNELNDKEKTSEWLQPIQTFLEKNKLPVDGSTVKYSAGHDATSPAPGSSTK